MREALQSMMVIGFVCLVATVIWGIFDALGGRPHQQELWGERITPPEAIYRVLADEFGKPSQQ